MSDFSFSKRTQWAFQENQLSSVIDDLKKQGVSIFDLTQSNPTECAFEYPQELLSALTSQENLHYAPQSKGLPSAREAIRAYYQAKGILIDFEHLILTSSTSEGYSFLLKLLTNPGDHVLIPAPSYPLFQFLLELHDVNFDYYPLRYNDGWSIDKEAFESLITPRTKAVILVNPNNPTGSFISPQELTFLNQMCLKHQMALISDEVFLDYPLNPSTKPQSLLANEQVPSFVLSGISKILALPQMKLSWIAVNGPQGFVTHALERLDIIADTYLSVNTPVQQALSTWMTKVGVIQQQIQERVKENLQVLMKQGLDVWDVQGGWYAIIHVPTIHNEEEFVLELLNQEHVLVHPGFFFDFEDEGFFVVSLITPKVSFSQAVEKIALKIKKRK